MESSRTLTDDEGRRIPIIWRTFHEMDGGWFCWGKGHAEPKDLVQGGERIFEMSSKASAKVSLLQRTH